MTVTAEELIRRFLECVLPTGFQKVRHFGFMHKRSKHARNRLLMLVTVTLNMVYVLIVAPPVSGSNESPNVRRVAVSWSAEATSRWPPRRCEPQTPVKWLAVSTGKASCYEK